jgi:hypothetical protein
MPFTATGWRSALARAILAILFLCSRPQMIRVYAAGIIASMANAQTFGDFALVELVANAMGAVALVTYANGAVTVSLFMRCPLPAFIRASFVHLGPKPRF